VVTPFNYIAISCSVRQWINSENINKTFDWTCLGVLFTGICKCIFGHKCCIKFTETTRQLKLYLIYLMSAWIKLMIILLRHRTDFWHRSETNPPPFPMSSVVQIWNVEHQAAYTGASVSVLAIKPWKSFTVNCCMNKSYGLTTVIIQRGTQKNTYNGFSCNSATQQQPHKTATQSCSKVLHSQHKLGKFKDHIFASQLLVHSCKCFELQETTQQMGQCQNHNSNTVIAHHKSGCNS